jgi:transcriptional regulator with XRE-family HTH domain
MTTKPPHEILRIQREAKGCSKAEMARTLNMDRSTYHRLELGDRRYLVDDAIAAADKLGVPLSRVTTQLAPSLRDAA